MKITFLFVMGIVSFTGFVSADPPPGEPRWVNSETGLKLRDGPNLNSKLIVVIPDKEELVLLEEKGGNVTISGATGKWSRIEWKTNQGWVFGGFLGKANPGANRSISRKDLSGEWSYYLKSSGTLRKYFAINGGSIIVYEPVKRESSWELSGDSVRVNLYGDGREKPIIQIEWKILEFRTDYLKIQETWSATDTSTRTMELHKNAKEKTAGKEEIRVFTGHTDIIKTARFSPDGKYILSGAYDRSLKLWDVESGKAIRTFTGHTAGVNSVDLSADGKYAISGSANMALKYWDLAAGRAIHQVSELSPILSVCFSPDGKFALLGLKNGQARVKDLMDGKAGTVFSGHAGEVSSVRYSPDGAYVLSGSYDKTLKLWNASTGKLMKTFVIGYSTYSSLVNSVCFSDDGRYALSGSSDKTMILWDINSGKSKMKFSGHTGAVTAVCFHPDGTYALSGSDDGTLKLWETDSGKEIKTYQTGEPYVYAVDISNDGKYALSAGGKTVKLWNLADVIR